MAKITIIIEDEVPGDAGGFPVRVKLQIEPPIADPDRVSEAQTCGVICGEILKVRAAGGGLRG